MKNFTLLKNKLNFLFFLFFLFFLVFNKISAQEADSLYLSMSLKELMSIDVVSASKQAEPLTEVPVPVTVITEDMIESSGAACLKDLLITYVPGITFVQDHNEINVAMRGVYASSQQKILIMLDGHRLNSRAYSEANPDFSMSLDKIKQIEVLRGPASSLYGNVALTAVINIITKKGGDINGGVVKLGAGNYGQQKFSMLYGKKFDTDNDFVFWGNCYRADGQEVGISAADDYSENPVAGNAIIDGIKDKPAYDVGFVYNSGNFSLLGNVRGNKKVEPFSAGGTTGEVYNYDDYRTIYGIGPGLNSQSAHFGIKYNKDIKKDINLSVNTYFDHNAVDVTLIIDPSIQKFGAPGWREFDYGAVLQMKKKYNFGYGHGNIIVGTQAEKMKVYDSFFPMGFLGEYTIIADNNSSKVLETGSEEIYSAFMQIKHRFSEKFIFNLGARYDKKYRHRGKNVSNLSPRLALIYLLNKKIDFKLSYSQSFVDAPYWYRYNSLASYKGSSNLKPEHLYSVQFTPTFHFLDNKFTYGFNTFYNKLSDFIYRVHGATGDDPRYRNAGGFESLGLENELTYLSKPLKIRANYTYQYAIDAEDYGVTDEKIHNVPNSFANIAFDYNPFYKKNDKFGLNLTCRYIGEQLSPIDSTFKGGSPYVDLNNTVDAVFLINAGFRINNIYGFNFSAHATNLFDKKYYQGGSVKFPYPQAGRWFIINIAYKFKI